MSDEGKKKKKNKGVTISEELKVGGSDKSKLLGQYGENLGSKSDATVIRELKALYKDKGKLLDIERKSKFNKFHHPEILDAELAAKPTVLLVGQYSTGKTTFIRHLIGQDYPQIHIGPEPTTDRFIAVVYGEEESTIKGNALTGLNDLPFSGLSTFGSSFLNKFSAAVLPAPLLAHMNIIDTPGVLSGEKQRLSRGYDFAKVSRWFAERSDLILLMFDCSKLDISDEFKNVIEELQPHEDKVHCVLNKADQLDTESLMRVYGALLWSMGRIFKGAEVSRIYVGSFNDEPLAREEHAQLFHKDELVLKGHLAELPKACSMRKVNEMVKRIRLCVVHVCVLGHLRSKMPYLWGQDWAQQELITNLGKIFEEVRRTYQLSEGDFPKLEEFQAKLRVEDFYTFPKIDRNTLQALQALLTEDIPLIISHIAGGGKNKSRLGGNAILDSDDDEEEYKDKGKHPNLFIIDENEKETPVVSHFLYVFIVGFLTIAIGLFLYIRFYSDSDSSLARAILSSSLSLSNGSGNDSGNGNQAEGLIIASAVGTMTQMGATAAAGQILSAVRNTVQSVIADGVAGIGGNSNFKGGAADTVAVKTEKDRFAKAAKLKELKEEKEREKKTAEKTAAAKKLALEEKEKELKQKQKEQKEKARILKEKEMKELKELKEKEEQLKIAAEELEKQKQREKEKERDNLNRLEQERARTSASAAAAAAAKADKKISEL